MYAITIVREEQEKKRTVQTMGNELENIISDDFFSKKIDLNKSHVIK